MHTLLRFALPLLLLACAAGGPSAKVRSTLPTRSTTEAVIDVLSTAVDPKEINGAAVSDDLYLVMTSWHVVGRSAGKVAVARAEIQVDGKDVRVRTEHRDCSTAQVTCELDGSYMQNRQMLQPKHDVDKLPEARDAAMFELATLTERIRTAVAK